MTTVPSPADASAKSLVYLSVEIFAGDFSFERDVYLVGDSSVEEIVAAMKEDWDFTNPLVQSGTLVAWQGEKCVTLAHYETQEYDDEPFGEIDKVTAHYDDDSSENVAV